MGKQLAIKGHITRGNEVIEVLKMLGGKAIAAKGYDETAIYVIPNNGIIDVRLAYKKHIDKYAIFTLEEFLEKYPLKIGDLKDLACDHLSCVITEMRWNEQAECMEYHTEFGPNDYGWHRIYDFCSDYQIEEPDTVISGIYLNSRDYADEVELNLGDYEIEIRGRRTYAVKKKPAYPTTYEECVEIMGVELYNTLWGEDATEYEKQTEDLVNAFIKLKVCRDAYWKIAGEQMGLDKPWEHNYLKDANTIRYAIYNTGDEIVKLDGKLYRNYILCFPTEELRDIFYKNFKDLIESCKELL